MDHSTSWSVWDIPILRVTLKTKFNAPPYRLWASLLLHDLLLVMKMNFFFWWIPWQSESVCYCLSWQSVWCLPWQSSLPSGVFCDNPSGVFRDNPSGVFHDNPSIPSSVFHEILLLSSMTIFYELFWRQSLIVLCASLLSYSELFCVLLFVMSSSEDSLLFSCVTVRCLTLSSSVFFYLLWALLKTVSCCPLWQSVVLLWTLLCSFFYASFAAWVSFFRWWLFFRYFRFVDPTFLRGFYFMQFQTQGFVILHLEFEGGC